VNVSPSFVSVEGDDNIKVLRFRLKFRVNAVSGTRDNQIKTESDAKTHRDDNKPSLQIYRRKPSDCWKLGKAILPGRESYLGRTWFSRLTCELPDFPFQPKTFGNG